MSHTISAPSYPLKDTDMDYAPDSQPVDTLNLGLGMTCTTPPMIQQLVEQEMEIEMELDNFYANNVFVPRGRLYD
jgi:hypothetical protein